MDTFPDLDFYCKNNKCHQLIARAYEVDKDSIGLGDAFVIIPPLDTLVLGDDEISGIEVYDRELKITKLLCCNCRAFLGGLQYYPNTVDTGENDDPEYLFRIGFDRFLFRTVVTSELPVDQFGDDVLEPLIGGLDYYERIRHDDLKRMSIHNHDDDL